MKKRYGLFTAITMITGVVIGSGIFFKSDDVLNYTNGNMLLGIIVFVVAAVAIIFGCLAISQLATLTDKPGGLISYAEDFVGMGTSCAFGWFQTFLYLPTLSAVVSWVVGIYFCQLFAIESTLENQVLIGVISMTVIFILNILSAKLGGYFQNASMIIKLIPLILIAVAGFIFGKPGEIFTQNASNFRAATTTWGWVAAFAPIAFSFDGWIVSTSICHEIKNSKRNLPIALTVSPFLILLAYVAYFIGMNALVGTETILEQGDGSFFTAANVLFGNVGAKIVLVFVVISVLGTVNGLVLGYIRMPYSLALRNMIPGSKSFGKEEKRLAGMPVNSAILAFIVSLFWMLVHYLTMKNGMRGDVSEIAIGVSYFNYIILYIAVIRLAKSGKIQSLWKGYLVPSFAIIGSFIILSGTITHPLFVYYLAVCMAIMFAGAGYYKKNKDHII